jgi:hypothetical protein
MPETIVIKSIELHLQHEKPLSDHLTPLIVCSNNN